MGITDKVKQLANEHGISIFELEQQLGLSNGTISKWDKASPKLENIRRVAEYFHVPLDYFTSDLRYDRILSYYTALYGEYHDARQKENAEYTNRFDQLDSRDREIVMKLIDVLIDMEEPQ